MLWAAVVIGMRGVLAQHDSLYSPIVRSETPFTMNASHPFLNTTNPHDEDINEFSKHTSQIAKIPRPRTLNLSLRLSKAHGKLRLTMVSSSASDH